MLQVHYMDPRDREMLAEIDHDTYVDLLTRYDGRDLAHQLGDILCITDSDPRVSTLEIADVFISYSDVFTGEVTAAKLLELYNDVTRR